MAKNEYSCSFGDHQDHSTSVCAGTGCKKQAAMHIVDHGGGDRWILDACAPCGERLVAAYEHTFLTQYFEEMCVAFEDDDE